MRVRIRSSSRVSPCHVSPVGARETNTVPAGASAPMRWWMRCQPGGVRYEPCSPPMPARAVETGQAATASPPANQVAICRSASTTSRRAGNADGAPGRARPSRASSSARVELDSIGAVTRALCHIGQPRRYPLVANFSNGIEDRRRSADPRIERLPPTTNNSSTAGSKAGNRAVIRAVVVRVTVVGTAISPIAVAVGTPATVIAVADVLDREGLADAINLGKWRGGGRAQSEGEPGDDGHGRKSSEEVTHLLVSLTPTSPGTRIVAPAQGRSKPRGITRN